MFILGLIRSYLRSTVEKTIPPDLFGTRFVLTEVRFTP